MAPSPDNAQAAQTAAAVIASAGDSLTCGDPLQAEMFASLLLNHTLELRWTDPEQAALSPAGIAHILSFVDEPTMLDAACSLVRAMAALEGDEIAEEDDPDDAVATMQEVLRQLQVAGGSLPDWSSAVGSPELLGAWVARDAWGDQASFYLGFHYPGHAPHTIVALVDYNLGGILKDAFVGEGPASVLAAWDKQVTTEPDAGSLMRLEEVTVADAVWPLLAALDTTEQAAGAPITEDLSASFALLEARLALLVRHMPPAPPRPQLATPLDDLEPEVLLARFLASTHFSTEPMASVVAAEIIVDHAANDVIGGMTRFSPPLAELLLLDRMAGIRDAHTRDELMESGIATTRAWARFCAEARSLPPLALEQTLRVVERRASDFLMAIAYPEADAS